VAALSQAARRILKMSVPVAPETADGATATTMAQQTSNPNQFWSRVLVVIPTLSARQAASVKALERQFRGAGAHVVVVANGRSALNALRSDELKAVTRERNLGFAAAVNLGRATCESPIDWVLLVNDDVSIDNLSPFDALVGRGAEPIIVSFGPEPSRPIPGIAGTLAALAMIPLGRFRSRDPIDALFTLPRGKYTAFSVVAVQRELWDRLGGLDERFPFMYEDADFARRAEQMGAERLALHVPAQIRHARGVAGRSNVRTVFPAVTWSALQYLQKWGMGGFAARVTCVVGLLIRVPLLPLSRAPLGEHLRAVFGAMAVVVGLRRASLPRFEDA